MSDNKLNEKPIYSGKGGYRPGAGRPKGSLGEVQRTQHQVRATDDEWELIKAFTKLVKVNKAECSEFILKHESK